MKKKAITIGLLIAVCGIWGLLFYKVYQSIQGREQSDSAFKPVVRMPPRQAAAGYGLFTYVRDPFLSILTDTAYVPEPEPDPVPVVIHRDTVTPPGYCGLIQNESKKLAILKLNNTFMIAEEGSTVDGAWKITSIKEKQVTAWHKSKKYILPFQQE